MKHEPINEELYAQAEILAQNYHDFVLSEGMLSDGSIMWHAVVKELPSVMAQGRKPSKAIRRCKEALVDYLYFWLVDNPPIRIRFTVTDADVQSMNFTAYWKAKPFKIDMLKVDKTFEALLRGREVEEKPRRSGEGS